MELNLAQYLRPLLALLFLCVYAYALIAGISIFYHFRWFGMRGDIKGKALERWFIIVNLMIFGGNAMLLGLLFTS